MKSGTGSLIGSALFAGLLLLAIVVVADVALGRSAVAQPLSASGQIAFQSERDGNWEIYSMGSDGSGQSRLTNNAFADFEPTWSPDGSKLLFASYRDVEAQWGRSYNWDLYVMNPDGTGETRLTTHPASDQSPSWSPDASKIAFTSSRAPPVQLFVMNADATDLRQLTALPGGAQWPSWAADGSRIAFLSWHDTSNQTYEIYVINADGSGLVRLTDNASYDVGPAWSPDGTKIAFEASRDGNGEIYVMNPDGTGQTRLTHHPANDGWPAWSSDGSKIAFHSSRDWGTDVWDIYVMDADGSDVTRLTTHPASDLFPDWQRRAGPLPPPPPPPPPPTPPPPSPPPAPPLRCVVPKVLGLRLATARTRIRRARCSVGRVRRAQSRRVGRVLAQSPRPGARRPRGARINLLVGRRRS